MGRLWMDVETWKGVVLIGCEIVCLAGDAKETNALVVAHADSNATRLLMIFIVGLILL